jgi:hypothetical protein
MDAVSAGYGDTGASPDGLWPALRIAVHAHDTIAYRPWPPARAIPEFVPLLHDLLDASALPLRSAEHTTGHPAEHLPERTSGASGNRDPHTPEQDDTAQRADPAH